MQAGSVGGAKVKVTVPPSGWLVGNYVTNQAGEFTFSYLPGSKQAQVVFDLYITAPSNPANPEKVSVTFTNTQGPTFTCVVMRPLFVASNRGGFAVSGRSNA